MAKFKIECSKINDKVMNIIKNESTVSKKQDHFIIEIPNYKRIQFLDTLEGLNVALVAFDSSNWLNSSNTFKRNSR